MKATTYTPINRQQEAKKFRRNLAILFFLCISAGVCILTVFIIAACDRGRCFDGIAAGICLLAVFIIAVVKLMEIVQ